MTITQAISSATALTGNVYSQDEALRWLSELDGQLAFEVYGVDSWTAYSQEDLDSLLLVPYPWDGLYVHKLEAMTYFSNGEYDRYANAQRMFEEALGEFKRFVQRTRAKCGEVTITQGGDGGSAVTAIVRGCDIWRYISAYGLAVLHGYEGTPEEWLESLKGADGEPGPEGAPGTVSFDELTPEQKAMLKGEDGKDGKDGADGVSPALSVGTVTPLAADAAPTVSMRGTQALPVLDFGIPTAGFPAVVLTQAEYEAMPTHDARTLYIITRAPAGIVVSAPPTKTSYVVGDALDLTGIAVSLFYTDGSAEPVSSGLSYSPANGTMLSSVGSQLITVSYTVGGTVYTATTTVSVSAS